MADPAGKTPFNAECGECGHVWPECGHVWPVCWLPMNAIGAAQLMKAARCPACASQDIKVHSPQQKGDET